MKQTQMIVLAQSREAEGILRLELAGDTSAITAPGQFVQLRVPGFYLRRPLSVCDWSERRLTLVYRLVGEGTKTLSEVAAGDELDMLTGLGNGFDVEADIGGRPVLVGGGVGTPPMVGLARVMLEKGIKPTVLLGFRGAGEACCLTDFRDMGLEPMVTTVDGSMGEKGMVTGPLPALNASYLFACGPEAMLKALYVAGIPGQFSFEARMACGFGACMGCSCHTVAGSKRICKEGPVLRTEELIW